MNKIYILYVAFLNERVLLTDQIQLFSLLLVFTVTGTSIVSEKPVRNFTLIKLVQSIENLNVIV